MNPIDDLFRDGLGGRKDDLPKDMWQRIQAGKPTAAPEGAELDGLFSDKLRDRRAPLPAGMWAKIMAARKPAGLILRGRIAALLVLLLLAAAFLFWPESNQDKPRIEPAAPAVQAEQEAVAENIASTSPEATLESTPSTDDTAGENAVVADAIVLPSGSSETKEQRESSVGETLPEVVEVSNEEVFKEEVREDLPNATVAEADGLVTPEDPTANAPEQLETVGTDRVVQAASPRLELSQRMLLDNPVQLPKLRRSQRPRPREGGAFQASPSGVQMELLFGVAYANQMFSIRDQVNRPLLDAREVSEFPETSYQVTARATWKLKERVYLLGGLTYAEVRNQLEYDQFINGVQTLVKTNNSIRLLEAPLLVGFSVPGRRMRVSLNVGPVINLTTSARGRFISPDAPGLQDLAVDADYRNNVGIGWMSSITTAYQIGKERPFTLLVEPFFKYYPSAFTTPSAALQEKYWVAGLQLGVRKSLQ
jgi:hypothetical protein